MKPKNSGSRLPAQAVAFTRKFITAGVPPQFFMSFDRGNYSELNFALSLAFMSRFTRGMVGPPSYIFTPVAIGWRLEAEDPAHHYLASGSQYDGYKAVVAGTGVKLDQLQPKLPPTIANVVEVKQSESGLKLLQELTQFRCSDSDGGAQEYILSNLLGIGLAHAKIVANTFVLRPVRMDDSTEVFGMGRSGWSLFVLVQYQAFADMQDKVGVTKLGWQEYRVLAVAPSEGRALVSFHGGLDVRIPEGSLLAVANIPWFKEPHSG
jgi:hypothetical protein